MTGTEIRVTGLDENSFRTLHVSILQKTNRAELTLGAAIHPHAYAWGIPRLFVKRSTKSNLTNLLSLKALPAEEQERLLAGIPAADRDQLSVLLEDYTS